MSYACPFINCMWMKVYTVCQRCTQKYLHSQKVATCLWASVFVSAYYFHSHALCTNVDLIPINPCQCMIVVIIPWIPWIPQKGKQHLIYLVLAIVVIHLTYLQWWFLSCGYLANYILCILQVYYSMIHACCYHDLCISSARIHKAQSTHPTNLFTSIDVCVSTSGTTGAS